MSEYKYLNELRTEELIDEVKRRLGVRLIVVNEMPESAPDGSARLYMGETTADYTKGHIYQYNDTEKVWNDVTKTVEVIKDVTVLPEGDAIKNIFYNLGADTWADWNLEVNFDVHPDVIPYPTVPLTTAQFDTIGWVGYNGSSSARNSSLTFFADTANSDAVKLGWFDGADIVELYAVQYASFYTSQNLLKTSIRLFDTYENYQSNTDIHTYEYVHADVDDKTTFTELRKWESSGIYAGNDTNDKLIRLATYADTIADYELSELSTKPVQNKVVTAALKDKVVRRFEMPVASEDNVGETAIYVGQTTEDYKLGHVYKSTGTLPGEYAWIDITSADVIVDVDELPTGAEIRDIIYRIAEVEYERVDIPMYEDAKDVANILTVYFGEPEINKEDTYTEYTFTCNPVANCTCRRGYSDGTELVLNNIVTAKVIAGTGDKLQVISCLVEGDTTWQAFPRNEQDGIRNISRWEIPTQTKDHYYMGDSTERKLDRIALDGDRFDTVIEMWDVPEKVEDVIYYTRAGYYSGGAQTLNAISQEFTVYANIMQTLNQCLKFNYTITEHGIRNGITHGGDYTDTEHEYEYYDLRSIYHTTDGGNRRSRIILQYRTDGEVGYLQLWNDENRYGDFPIGATFRIRYVLSEDAYWIGNSTTQTITRLATYDEKLSQYKVMPELAFGNYDNYLGRVVMYIGETNENYTCGHLYKGIQTPSGYSYTYSWQDVTDVPTADSVVWVTDFPTAPDIKNVVYGKITTTTEYTNEKTVGLDSLDTETRITLDGDSYISASTDDVYVKGGDVSDYEVFVSFNTTTNELTTSEGTYTLETETELTFATQTTTETKSFRIGNEDEQTLSALDGSSYTAGYNIKISNENEISENSFVGTTAEYEALSQSEQDSFDEVDLSDDYTQPNTNTGHQIVDENGDGMPQRNDVQFTGGVEVTDDSENDKTVVEVKKYTGGRGIEVDEETYEIGAKEEVKLIFDGTKEEFDALPLEEKVKYDWAAFNDDVTESADIYSTEEVRTNKMWIDGKPIYRKVLVFNNPKWDWTPNTFNIPDISQVVTANFIAYPDTVNHPNMCYTDNWTLIESNHYLSTTINSGRFLIKTNAIEATSDSKVIWTIEYTKND